MQDYIVAIDLGSTYVVTLVGRRQESGEIELVAGAMSDSRGIIRGEIKNLELTAKALREAVASVEAELGIHVVEAYVGISGQHIKCSRHNGYMFIENNDGEVKEWDVQRLNDSMRNVQLPLGESIIHILPQNYLVDGDSEMKEPVGVVGKKLEATFNIVTGDKAAISRIDKCLERIGMKCNQLILNSLASAESVLGSDDKELGVAVVDLGGGTTDVTIYYDNIIRHVAVIPLGGNLINKDIRSFGILERHVEALKIKYGSALSELAPADKYITKLGLNSHGTKEISLKNLSGIIEARLLDIVDCVEREIKRSGYADSLDAGIVLMGGGAQIKDIDELFRRHLGYEVRILNASSQGVVDQVGILDNPVYATAMGLLKRGLELGGVTRVEKGFRPPVAGDSESNTPVAATLNEAYRRGGRSYEGESIAEGAQEQSEECEGESSRKEKKGLFSKLRETIDVLFNPEVIDDNEI